MVYNWLQCEFPLRAQAAGGFVRLGGAADDCRYPVVSALLFIAAAGILLCLSLSLSFHLTEKKKKAWESSSAWNKYKTKCHKLQYVSITTSAGVVKENGCQTGAHPITPYSFTYFVLPFFSHLLHIFLRPFLLFFISLSYSGAHGVSLHLSLNEEKSILSDWFPIILGGLTPHSVPKK